jgi:hypothetical protein
MSKVKAIIEVTPETHQQVYYRETVSGFRCPVCNGKGGHTHQTGYDEWEGIHCDYCDATGKVKAEVSVEWGPDYD